MNKSNFDSLTNVDVQTLNEPITRSDDEGYQLDVHVCNVQESRLYTYSRTEGLYRFSPGDHSDLLEALDAIFRTVWILYADESSEDGYVPTRCEGDGYEVHVEIDDKSACPIEADFSRFQNFSINLNEQSELAEDLDRLFASLP